MTIEFNNNQGSGVLMIDDEMTIYTAATLKKELLGHLNDCHELEISLEKVSEMDSTGVQMMLLLHAEAERSHKILRFVRHSNVVIDVLELLNLGAHFGDPIVFSAQEKEHE